MPLPAPDWLDALPEDRLLAEFSMWSADLLALGPELARVAPHADLLHVDVADGHFAPALLFFPDLVARMREATGVPIHIHLMTADDVLLAQARQFAEAGADLISVHAENRNAAEALALVGELGKAGGVVLRVETPVEAARPLLPHIRFLTLLGTAIGVKGQGLDPTATARLEEAKRMIGQSERRIVLAADGGIRENTVPALRAAGAETVVLGSLAFGATDLAARIRWLHAL